MIAAYGISLSGPNGHVDATLERNTHFGAAQGSQLFISGDASIESRNNLVTDLRSVIGTNLRNAGSLRDSITYVGNSNLIYNVQFGATGIDGFKMDANDWQTLVAGGEKVPAFSDPRYAHSALINTAVQVILPPLAFQLQPTSVAVRRDIGCNLTRLPGLPPELHQVLRSENASSMRKALVPYAE